MIGFTEALTADEKALLITYFGEKLPQSTELNYYYISLEDKTEKFALLMSSDIRPKVQSIQATSVGCEATPAPSVTPAAEENTTQ
jgi:hypothetical protein